MKPVVMCLIVMFVCNTSYASIRGDFDVISRERGAYNAAGKDIEKEYCDKFFLSIENAQDNEIVAAYQNVRDVKRLFNQCWSLFCVAVMSLYDGETKFSVVPKAVEQIEEVKGMLVKRFPEMINAAEGYKNEHLRSIMSRFLMELKGELVLVDRYIDLLTKY